MENLFFFSPLQISNTPKISVWRFCQRKSIFVSYAAITLCCEMASPEVLSLSGYFVGNSSNDELSFSTKTRDYYMYHIHGV